MAVNTASERLIAGMIAVSFSDIFIGTISLSTSSFTVYAILKSGIWRKTRFYIMLMCMSIGAAIYDTGVTFGAGILRLDEFLGNGHFTVNATTQTQCAAMAMSIFFGAMYYQWIMMLVAIERCYAIMAPMHYRAHSAKIIHRALISSTIFCVCSTLACLIGTQNQTPVEVCTSATATTRVYYLIYVMCFGFTPGLLACSIYLAVWIISKIKHDKVQDAIHPQKRRHASLTKLVSSVLVVYAMTSIAAAPVASGAVVFKDSNPRLAALLNAVVGILLSVNHLGDLAVYFFRSEELKTVFKDTLRQMMGRVNTKGRVADAIVMFGPAKPRLRGPSVITISDEVSSKASRIRGPSVITIS